MFSRARDVLPPPCPRKEKERERELESVKSLRETYMTRHGLPEGTVGDLAGMGGGGGIVDFGCFPAKLGPKKPRNQHGGAQLDSHPFPAT